MEEYTKIEDYLLLNNDNNIEKHRSTPFSGILLLAGGIILIPLGLHAAMSDIIQMTILTAGTIAALAGLFIVIFNVTSKSSHFIYKPTGAKMKRYRRYINADNRQTCRDSITSSHWEAFENIAAENSTGTLLHIYMSVDERFALVQLEEYVPHEFHPITPVTAVTAEGCKSLSKFLKR